MALLVVMRVSVVRVVRAVLRVSGGWLLMVVPVVLAGRPGSPVVVPRVRRVWPGRRGRVTGPPVVPVVPVVRATVVVLVVMVVPVVPGTRRAALMALTAALVVPVVRAARAVPAVWG